MARRGVTTQALAERAGIARSTLIRRLSVKGDSSPLTVTELHSIAKVLDISVDVLIRTSQVA
jgi:transcriptional regulator with XRE-family HTH domain